VVAVLVGSAFVPPLTTANNLATSTVYAYGGMVNLLLPPGGSALENRTTTLRIDFSYAYQGNGVFFGPGDIMRVWLWVPASNAFVPVAIIQNNPNASLVTWLQGVLNGTLMAQNIITVNSSELQVNKVTDDVITANLTVPENITIGDPFAPTLKALNFTLPPIALEVRGFDGQFNDQVINALPSGWNVTTAITAEPAWVRVWIPQWLGPTYWMAEGTNNLQVVTTYTSP